MLTEDLKYIMKNVNLTNDPVMKPLSLALCVRMKNALPQISFSKETSSDIEIITLPFEFDMNALYVVGTNLIDYDPVSHVMQVISDECIEKFKSYKPFTVNFCGIYKTDINGKFNVIFKIVK